VETGKEPIMEEVLCAMALKSSNGRQTHHACTHYTLSGHRVCCERALKSCSERNTHGGGGAAWRGGLRETACTGGFGS
jgi:hypothetical protein